MAAVRTTEIPGLLMIDLDVHGDSRGWFKENWQRATLVEAGLPDTGFVQNNISFNAAVGTTRGIHAEPWDKYVSVACGEFFGAWVDLREGESFGTVVTARVGPGTAVYVPRGVGNSFQTLQPDTAYTYLVSDHWSAAAVDGYQFVNLADPQLDIAWPIPLEEVEMSEKDRNHPFLREVAPAPAPPIIITGAGGQLGRALVAACEQARIPHRAFDRAGWDIAAGDPAPVDLRAARAVINAAAFTDVDGAQTHEGAQAAYAANATAVSRLAAACARADTPLLHVSTDYVFDGSLPQEQSYDESHPVSPLGVYGASKAAGEMAAAAWEKSWIVRTSWVIGEGRNFVGIMADLAARGVKPTVVDDQRGRLTFAQDLAQACLHLVRTGAQHGVYHCSNAGPVVSWCEIAQRVFELSGAAATDVTPVSTRTYFADRPDAAPRPANSALSLDRLEATGFTPADWRTRLQEMLGSAS